MTDDNSANAAAKTPPPQSAGIDAQAPGAAQSGDDAPMFADSDKVLTMHLLSRANTPPPVVSYLLGKSLCLFGVAFLYAGIFVVAGWLEGVLPQFYRAWLDFCMPLVEYVGELSPRTGRVTGQLIAGGYPERVDDARHGIAMARILLLPAVILYSASILILLLNAPRAVPCVVVSCTRRTHIYAWLSFLGIFAFGFVLFGAMEFGMGEDFGPWTVYSLVSYHKGNFAMVADVLMLSVSFLCMIETAPSVQIMLRARLNIVKQNPGDKS